MAFFVWIAALGKCLTIDNLRKRKVWILDWCYMCKCNGELVDHIFLQSGCYGFVVYDFGFIWSKLGYAAICCGAPSLLARQAWLS